MRCESITKTTISHEWEQELNHFKRQYLQLQVTIKYPERQYLKDEEFQNELYTQTFSQDALKYHPPQRYQLRVLKELIKRIEDSIADSEEEDLRRSKRGDERQLMAVSTLPFAGFYSLNAPTKSFGTGDRLGLLGGTSTIHPRMQYSNQVLEATALTSLPQQQSISDSLMNCFASLLTTRMPFEAEAAQEKSYVTYSITCIPGTEPSTITILESRNLLGGTGTTGFRTWEACLQLGVYLCSSSCPPELQLASKTILELGCGTGYLSVLCAKYLNATHITATDGFPTVVDYLDENFLLNDLEISPLIRTRLLKWGKGSFAQCCGNDETFLEGKAPDVILGADVTYDAAALPALCETLKDLLEVYPKTQILIASTVRNEGTFQKFLQLCEEHGFERESLEWEPIVSEMQKGPFYRVDMPVRMSRITARGGLERLSNQAGA